MKINKISIYSLLSILVLQLYGCEDILEPRVYSETAPNNLFNSVQGLESVLFGAYAKSAEMPGSNVPTHNMLAEENMGDFIFSNNAGVVNFKNFIINPGVLGGGHMDELWLLPYEAIRNTNIILENIDDAAISASAKELIRSEAMFIRAISYLRLYNRFGPVPLRTNSLQELEMARASEAELLTFIETELSASVPGLPDPGEESAYGRAHKGAALGYLVKFYLQTKEWQKVADRAQDIIDLNAYGLFPDYFSLFFVANERNEELIWVRTAKADLNRTAANTFMNIAYPPSFQSHPRTGLEFPPGARIFSGGLYIYDDAYDSFDPADKRKDLIIGEYINTSGELIDLTDNPNGRRVFKYWPDSDIAGPAYGNDIPVIRYADVLLSRAEALNELNGPNQESVDLVNEVRDRAGVSWIDLANFPTKEALRDHILQERAWEFYLEGHRRLDLIRHGKLIERAQDRGLPAEDFHVRFPIPTFAMDANQNLEQNPGY